MRKWSRHMAAPPSMAFPFQISLQIFKMLESIPDGKDWRYEVSYEPPNALLSWRPSMAPFCCACVRCPPEDKSNSQVHSWGDGCLSGAPISSPRRGKYPSYDGHGPSPIYWSHLFKMCQTYVCCHRSINVGTHDYSCDISSQYGLLCLQLQPARPSRPSVLWQERLILPFSSDRSLAESEDDLSDGNINLQRPLKMDDISLLPSETALSSAFAIISSIICALLADHWVVTFTNTTERDHFWKFRARIEFRLSADKCIITYFMPWQDAFFTLSSVGLQPSKQISPRVPSSVVRRNLLFAVSTAEW